MKQPHHNYSTSDEIARRTWYKSTGKGTSAHYQVTPDKIWGCVGENFVAYHAGNYPVNQSSIGIEHLNDKILGKAGELSTIAEDTYKNSAKLIADICKRYSIPMDRKHIIGHKEASATSCPAGIDIDKLIRMAKVEYDKLSGKSTPQPSESKPTVPTNSVSTDTNTQKEDTMLFAVVRSVSGKQGYVGIANGKRFGISDIKTVQELQKAGAKHLNLPDADFDRFLGVFGK